MTLFDREMYDKQTLERKKAGWASKRERIYDDVDDGVFLCFFRK